MLSLLLALMCATMDCSYVLEEWNKDEIAFDGFPRTVAVRDVDGDGYLDVVSGSSGGDYFFWLRNDGKGSFEHDILGTMGEAKDARDVFVIDVDQDGYLDIVAASGGDDTIVWYKQTQSDGNVSFTRNVISTTADNPQSIFAIDLDGDGDIDILSGNFQSEKITWFENDGDQSFTSKDIVGGLTAIYEIFAIDIDGDGDVDIVSATGQSHSEISWHENDGAGSFTQRIVFQDASSPRCIYPIDFDGDGFIDILAGSEDDNTVWFFKNEGAQTFSNLTISTDATGVRGIFVADVDKDGDLDVVAALYRADSLVWYETDGANYKKHSIDYSGCDGAFAVVAANFTNDAHMNIVLASENDNRVSLYTPTYVDDYDFYRIQYWILWILIIILVFLLCLCVACCCVSRFQKQLQNCTCCKRCGCDSHPIYIDARSHERNDDHSRGPRATPAVAVILGTEVPVVSAKVQDSAVFDF